MTQYLTLQLISYIHKNVAQIIVLFHNSAILVHVHVVDVQVLFYLQSSVFPPENQVSPVADELRKLLSVAPWARVGLGLPVVSSKNNYIIEILPWFLASLLADHNPLCCKASLSVDQNALHINW